MFKSIFTAIIMLAATTTATMAYQNHDIYIKELPNQIQEVHCKNCFSDFKRPNDVKLNVKYTDDKFAGGLMDYVESENYVLFQSFDSMACQGGLFHWMDKRGSSKKGLVEIKPEICDYLKSYELIESNNHVSAKFIFNDKKKRPLVIKLK